MEAGGIAHPALAGGAAALLVAQPQENLLAGADGGHCRTAMVQPESPLQAPEGQGLTGDFGPSENQILKVSRSRRLSPTSETPWRIQAQKTFGPECWSGVKDLAECVAAVVSGLLALAEVTRKRASQKMREQLEPICLPDSGPCKVPLAPIQEAHNEENEEEWLQVHTSERYSFRSRKLRASNAATAASDINKPEDFTSPWDSRWTPSTNAGSEALESPQAEGIRNNLSNEEDWAQWPEPNPSTLKRRWSSDSVQVSHEGPGPVLRSIFEARPAGAYFDSRATVCDLDDSPCHQRAAKPGSEASCIPLGFNPFGCTSRY